MTLSCHHRNSTRPACLLALNDEVNDACRALAAPVTSSFGVAALQLQEAGSALLARADGALYQAKQQGRDRVVAARPANTAGEGLASVAQAPS